MLKPLVAEFLSAEQMIGRVPTHIGKNGLIPLDLKTGDFIDLDWKTRYDELQAQHRITLLTESLSYVAIMAESGLVYPEMMKVLLKNDNFVDEILHGLGIPPDVWNNKQERRQLLKQRTDGTEQSNDRLATVLGRLGAAGNNPNTPQVPVDPNTGIPKS